jgi:hypothetical protein
MSRFFSTVLVGVTGLLFIGLFIVVTDPTGYQLKQRDLKRKQDVEAIARTIETYVKKNQLIPGFSATPQQIGTEKNNCQLQTKFCQIDLSSCQDLNLLTEQRDLSLPSDLKIGSYYKTGYALSYDKVEQVVTIVSCGVEGNETISIQKSLKDLLLTATQAAAVSKDAKK